MVVILDKEKKAHKAIDVTHVFIKFMPDVSLQKALQVKSATTSLKYLAVTKSLIKPLFVYEMNKQIFQKTARCFIPGSHILKLYCSRCPLSI